MNHQKSNTNVVPFRGEMYPEVATPVATPQASSNGKYLLSLCIGLVGMGAALGATITYNSTDQVQLRAMQQQLQQFDQVKQQLCKGG